MMSISLVLGGIAAQQADDDSLPPGTIVHVSDITAHVATIENRVSTVAAGSPASNMNSAAISAPKQDAISAVSTGITAKETAHEIVLELSADILFDFDHSNLKAAAESSLQKIAGVIRNHSNHGLRIDGYTDAKGSFQHNQKLSLARAEAVRAWLVSHASLPTESLSVAGHGASDPIASNTKPDGSDDPIGRQKNRRVAITIEK